MLIRDLCTTDVVTARRSTTVVEAARIMRERHTGNVVVIDDGPGEPRPIGIITDRDLAICVLAQAPERATELTIGDIMPVRELLTVREDVDVDDALSRMRAGAVRRLPVVDAHGALRGVIALDDAFVALADEMGVIARLVRTQPRRERRDRP